MGNSNRTIFDRIRAGEITPFDDTDYFRIHDACAATKKLVIALNNEPDPVKQRQLLSNITGRKVSDSTTVFTPFSINYGKNLQLGSNVFINANCSFLDLGGITIEDGVMIAPAVVISSESHPVGAEDRRKMLPGHVHINKGAWIGANATVLSGVTIGENSVVAAGAVVTADVPNNVVVGGIPAKVIKKLNE